MAHFITHCFIHLNAQNKIGTNKAQIEKMKVEYEQAFDEAQKSVENSEELGVEQDTKVILPCY